MKKKNIILVIILIILPLLYYVINRDVESNSTVSKEHFAIKNLEQIDRIFISENKTKKFALLSKDNQNIWRVNNNWVVNESRMRILLETIRDIEVNYEVEKNAIPPILQQIAANGVKTMIYRGDKLIKSYFVGSPTSNNLGTYILEEGSNTPMVVHIPGMNGFVSSRYFTDSIEWRNKNIFNIPREAIEQVNVNWHQTQEHSFVIKNTKGAPQLLDSKGNKVSDANELKLKAFLNLFMVYENNNLACEGYHKEFDASKADSIAQSIPFFSLTVIQKDGLKKTIKLYRKPIQVNTYEATDDEGNLLEYEIDKYWGVLNDESLIMEIQDLIFAKVLKKKTDFN